MACAGALPPDPPPRPAASVSLALGGDVMLARLVDWQIHQQGPRYVWGNLLPSLQGADLALVNLECTIATSGEPFLPRRAFYFRARPEAMSVLDLGGIDYVSLANNHALDYGPAALRETLRRLDEAHIAHAGAGPDLEEAAAPALLRVHGLNVAVVAFADHFDLYRATASRPGINFITVTTTGPDFLRVRQALGRVRAAGADLTIFSLHWGPNLRDAPDSGFVAFAHAVMDAGADIFFGHSAHVFQGIELYRGKPILFDTGDLLDDYAPDPVLRSDQQLLFLLEVNRQGVERIELLPLVIHHAQVNRATSPDFEQIAERIRRLSAPMGTRIERRGDRLEVLPSALASPE
jgi:poly-gamma-glutamate capsule biosynthesis protein CapA/YwtB (metallophosphatase superfamily)